MNLDNVYVTDLETRGLLDKLNSWEDFHVLGIGWKNKNNAWQIKTTNNFDDVQKVFGNKNNYIVMHNGIRYDKPALEKMGIKVEATIIDTLALAWNLYPNRVKEGKKYGLESFGEDFGVPKPKIDDWENLTYEEYVNRVTEDVKINIQLWENLLSKGREIYSDNPQDFLRLINILDFIMLCAHKQEMRGLHVDVKKCEENLKMFEDMKEEKVSILKEAMPKIPIKKIKTIPKTLYKKDGTLSKAGEEWMFIVDSLGLPRDYSSPIEVITGYSEANPNSVKQKKDWLYSLGWKPKTFKHNRDKETNEVKVVEQIMTDDKMLCPSVLKLSEKEPAILAFDGVTVMTHRIGLLKGFLEKSNEDNMIVQGLQQLAVTQRWMHKDVVNLPKFTGKGDIRDGKWIRECLVPPKGYKIVQSDLSGIESRTSDHYTFHINPDRIKKTKMPFFDPHTEISVFSGLMTEGQEVFYIYKSAVKENPSLDVNTFSELYKPNDETYELLSLPEDEQKEWMNKLKNVRSKGKTCNYSSLYLVGSQTLSRTLEVSKKEAQELIESYWKIHHAVKEFTDSLLTKKVGEETWIYNPIARFWYNLRNEKDKFSVINQSSAVYCFNMWLYFITKRGEWAVNQTHDDLVLLAKEGDEERAKQIFHDAMDDLNEYLKLNVKLDCESQIGNSLAETH